MSPKKAPENDRLDQTIEGLDGLSIMELFKVLQATHMRLRMKVFQIAFGYLSELFSECLDNQLAPPIEDFQILGGNHKCEPYFEITISGDFSSSEFNIKLAGLADDRFR